jgi:hypothetical protein
MINRTGPVSRHSIHNLRACVTPLSSRWAVPFVQKKLLQAGGHRPAQIHSYARRRTARGACTESAMPVIAFLSGSFVAAYRNGLSIGGET